MASYDKYYSDNNQYFGEANSTLIEFFKCHEKRGSVVDLGAGQGRNSILLSSLGYEVTAVDISKVGLNQIVALQPNIKTKCASIYEFDAKHFDFVLMDSMLHFYKRDIKKETNLVRHILHDMKSDSVFVNCMIFSKHSYLLDIINEYDSFTTLISKDFYYNKSTKYHFIAIYKS